MNRKLKTDRVILGKDCIYSSDCSETQLNNNVIVCGSSGSGKTMSISEPRLLETVHSSLVITLSKRRLVAKYKPLFEKRGYQVLDLNFIQPARSNISYDPLTYVKSHRDIVFLAEAIVKADPKKHEANSADPYWDAAAVSLLSAEIAYIMMAKKGISFTDVLEFHDSLYFLDDNGTIVTSLDEKFDKLEEKNPACFAVSCWKSFRRLPIRTAGCVYGALNTTLDTIFSPELRKMMAMRRKIDFEELATRKTILFVSTSAVNPALSCFINIFYSHVFKELFEFAEGRADGVLPIPVHVLCDDFATGSTILNFPQYISIFREKLLSVTLLLQSESQLKSIYGDCDATTIINNCDTYIYMGGMDLETARSISLRVDWPLSEVLSFPVGQEIVFRRGHKPVITERYNVAENRLYQELTRYHQERIEAAMEIAC